MLVFFAPKISDICTYMYACMSMCVCVCVNLFFPLCFFLFTFEPSFVVYSSSNSSIERTMHVRITTKGAFCVLHVFFFFLFQQIWKHGEIMRKIACFLFLFLFCFQENEKRKIFYLMNNICENIFEMVYFLFILSNEIIFILCVTFCVY